MDKSDDKYVYQVIIKFVLLRDDEETQRYITQVKMMTRNPGT